MDFLIEGSQCCECNKHFEENDEITVVDEFIIREIIPPKSAKLIHSERIVASGDLKRSPIFCSKNCMIEYLK